MALTPMYANIELADGTILTDLRVTYADRARTEKTAKARGWDAETQNVTISAFVAWCAAQRLGHITLTYAEYLDVLVDAQVNAEAAQEDSSEDPTQTGA